MHPDWLISLRDQCAVAAGVPFLFKQWGEWAPVCAIDERVVTDEQLYRPRLAVHQPEGPRRCKVRQLVMYADGRRFDMDEWSRPVGPEAPWFSAENRGTDRLDAMSDAEQLPERIDDDDRYRAAPSPPDRRGSPGVTCEHFTIPGGGSAIVCSSGGARRCGCGARDFMRPQIAEAYRVGTMLALLLLLPPPDKGGGA
jgi:hypothetical protein